MHKTTKQVSIIIPVYNGENSIAKLIDHLIEMVPEGLLKEIVLVNDCSPDKSERECIRAYRKHEDKVSFYSLSKNVGEHNAVMAGLNMATGDFAVIIDDDFQNPVSEVIKLINHMVDNQFDDF